MANHRAKRTVVFIVLIALITIAWRGTGNALKARLDYWTAATRTIADHPWKGVGVGGFGAHYQHYLPTGEYSASAHNDFLELSTSYGLPAGVLFAGILGVVLWRSYSEVRGQRSEVNLGYWCALLAFAVQGLVESLLYVPALGIMAAVGAGKCSEVT